MVLQPGFEPLVMSMRPKNLLAYSQGLRKPSGNRPIESIQSLGSDIMPATTCKLAVSWVLEAGSPRYEGDGGRRTGTALLVPLVSGSLCQGCTCISRFSKQTKKVYLYLIAWVAMSGVPRPEALYQVQIRNRFGRDVITTAGCFYHLLKIQWDGLARDMVP